MRIAHPSRFDDWALGVKQVNPLAYYWTRLYGVLTFSGPVIALFEHTWPLPLPLLLGTIFVLFGMLYVGTKYDGIVKAMALPHAIGVGTATAITAQWAFVDDMVTMNNGPISYVWACVTVPYLATMTIIDLYNMFEWFILMDRKVTRSKDTVSAYIKKGRLPAETKNVQWLMKRGVSVNELCDSYGFLARNDSR